MGEEFDVQKSDQRLAEAFGLYGVGSDMLAYLLYLGVFYPAWDAQSVRRPHLSAGSTIDYADTDYDHYLFCDIEKCLKEGIL